MATLQNDPASQGAQSNGHQNGNESSSDSRHQPSHYNHEKQEGLKSEAEIRALPLPSDGPAGEKLDEPSWEPNPIHAQFPDTLRPMRLTEPEHYAAGMPAVFRSMEHLAMNKSLLRGGTALTHLNHAHGVDCMSCAWPEKDGHRKMAEFCENGAKAVAWETDSRKCGPEFFAKTLARRSLPPGRILARPAGPAHRADGPARRREPLHPDLLGPSLPVDRR